MSCISAKFFKNLIFFLKTILKYKKDYTFCLDKNFKSLEKKRPLNEILTNVTKKYKLEIRPQKNTLYRCKYEKREDKCKLLNSVL